MASEEIFDCQLNELSPSHTKVNLTTTNCLGASIFALTTVEEK